MTNKYFNYELSTLTKIGQGSLEIIIGILLPKICTNNNIKCLPTYNSLSVRVYKACDKLFPLLIVLYSGVFYKQQIKV